MTSAPARTWEAEYSAVTVHQLAHQRIPVAGRVVHHLLGVKIVARAAAFDHVAGESEGRSAETDHGNFAAKCFATRLYGFGDITEFGGAVGAELGDIFAEVRTGFSMTGPSPAEK